MALQQINSLRVTSSGKKASLQNLRGVMKFSGTVFLKLSDAVNDWTALCRPLHPHQAITIRLNCCGCKDLNKCYQVNSLKEGLYVQYTSGERLTHIGRGCAGHRIKRC